MKNENEIDTDAAAGAAASAAASRETTVKTVVKPGAAAEAAASVSISFSFFISHFSFSFFISILIFSFIFPQMVPDSFVGLETFFSLAFLGELVLKLITERQEFFLDPESWKWNVFDFFIVMLALIEEISKLSSSGGGNLNLTFLRMFRICRKFFEVFGCIWTFSDAFGPIRTHSYTFSCIRIRVDARGRTIPAFSRFLVQF